MTEREEIDMLRRAVADLTERVRTLEVRPAWPNSLPQTLPATCVDPLFGRPVMTCVGGGPRDGSTTQSWLAASRGEA